MKSGPQMVGDKIGASKAGSGGLDDGRHTGTRRASELNESAFGLMADYKWSEQEVLR